MPCAAASSGHCMELHFVSTTPTARWLFLAVSFAAMASKPAAQSNVAKGGWFYRYDGPASSPICPGKPPTVDPASTKSYFFDTWGDPVNVVPQVPYPGYEDAAFANTGTASYSGSPDRRRVTFWNRIDGVNQPVNALAFSLIARPDPFIGTSPCPGYHFWKQTLVLNSTFGPAAPDMLSFAGSPYLGSVAVNEGVTRTFEIWGRIGSLEPIELHNPSAGVGLLDAVPESESYAMLLAGLCPLGFMRRQKNRTAA
jgi:hypothetical protein